MPRLESDPLIHKAGECGAGQVSMMLAHALNINPVPFSPCLEGTGAFKGHSQPTGVGAEGEAGVGELHGRDCVLALTSFDACDAGSSHRSKIVILRRNLNLVAFVGQRAEKLQDLTFPFRGSNLDQAALQVFGPQAAAGLSQGLKNGWNLALCFQAYEQGNLTVDGRQGSFHVFID